MALSPGPRRRTTTGDEPHDPELNPMQELLGSMDRPIPRTSDENDVNLTEDPPYTTTATSRTDNRNRGFTTTFAIIAGALVAAFLVALYLGSDRMNQANVPGETQAPIADNAPGTVDDTTGSTTPVQPAPDGGGSTGTGTTAPSNP